MAIFSRRAAVRAFRYCFRGERRFEGRSRPAHGAEVGGVATVSGSEPAAGASFPRGGMGLRPDALWNLLEDERREA
jgi:hypothetical protein